MTASLLNLSEIKLAFQKEKLNFKVLSYTDHSVIFIDESTKVKLRGKIVRSFNEGEVYHWPLLNHDNIDKLIDILCVRDDLFFYLSIYSEITLKSIVHDQSFMYDSRCFDRKRSYAKGIFAGLSYLHGKSLTLMNLCDDNIIISIMDDRAIITNFDHLICERKSTRSKLNVPEIYMAPETEENEFDSIKAEIWASGILMLDMFLTHMVPWDIVDFESKKVIKIVDNLSLDLLQAANAGSVVSAIDLKMFKIFLKRFFRQNPQERIPAKYACITSFLQNRSQYKVYEDCYQSASFPHDMLSLDYSNPNLSIYFNPTYTCSNSQKTEGTDILPEASIIETQQAESPVQLDENKAEVDTAHIQFLENNIYPDKQENSSKMTLLPTYKTVASIVNAEEIGDFQKISKSWKTDNEDIKAEIESSYNCCQSKSLTFLESRNTYSTFKFGNTSSKNCHSNDKPLLVKQSVECDFPSSDIHLNPLFNSNVNNDYKNEINGGKDGNDSVTEPGCEKSETRKRFSEIDEIERSRMKIQIKRIPSKQDYRTFIKIDGDSTINPLRNFKDPQIFLSPEIGSVIKKITFLRRCYVSIHAQQKVFISNRFANEQRKLIKEYKHFLYLEDLRLREMLRKQYKLKLEDVAKIMKYVNYSILSLRNQYETLSMNNNFVAISRNVENPKIQGMKDTIKDNMKYFPDAKDMNSLTSRSNRNFSYHKAIENTEKNNDRKWEITGQDDNEKSQKTWEKINFDPKNKMKRKLISGTRDYDKITEEDQDVVKKEVVKEYETMRKCVKNIDKIQCNKGARPKKALDKNNIKKEEDENQTNFKTVINSDKSNIKAKTKTEPTNEKHIKKMKSDRNKKMKGKLDKKVKNQRELKKQEQQKRSWFFSLCPGGKI